MSDATLLDAAEARLAPLERAAFEGHWALAREGSAEHEAAARDAGVAYDSALADPELLAGAIRAEDGLTDPIDKRRATLLRLMTGPKQRPRALIEEIVALETELTALYSGHRGSVRGGKVADNEIDEILRVSADAELRRDAWEAAKSIGPLVDGKLRALARLRNEAAQRAGHRDHYAMSLAYDELDEAWLNALLDRLDESLDESWTREKQAIDADVRERVGVPAAEPLRPWHYSDAFFQEPPSPRVDPLADGAADAIDAVASVRAYFNALGHDVDGILARSDLYPREGKEQHAFQMCVDRAGDIRTLCNIVPGLRSLETLLHELGHAVYDQSIDDSLPWLVRTPAHTFVTEAIAMLHGRRARDRDFLDRFTRVEDAVASLPLNGAIERRRLHVFVPWVQVMVRFEQRFYADPDGDHAVSWWELVERYQRVARPPGDRPHDWATKIHLAMAPVYYHNYLLGELAASQISAMLERETGARSPAARPEQSGRLIRERLLAHGAREPWDPLIERATGEPLAPRHLVAELR